MTTVTVRSRHNFQQEIVAGDHYLFADEPQSVGGDDTGPDPYSFLLGALGACTAITLKMYAQRKQWDLQSVEIELTHNHDYLKDCEECGDKPVKIDRITRQLTFVGNLDAAQRQRLAEFANRCPVHQTLTGRIEITDLPVR